MKRIVSCMSVACLLVAFGACTTNAHHQPKSYISVGKSLPIVVTIRNPEEGISISGTLHYRLGTGSYLSLPMQSRGSELWVEIPATSVPAGGLVEYYIDVQSGPKLLALASPAKPFRVNVYGREQIIRISLKHSVIAHYDNEPITFVLTTGEFIPESAKVNYEMPAVSGEVNADMQRNGNRFSYTVPAQVVHTGYWRYKITAVVEGKAYMMPQKGVSKFEVTKAPPPPPAPEPEHQHKD